MGRGELAAAATEALPRARHAAVHFIHPWMHRLRAV